jgi:gliding motility-associated-like protein
VDEGGNTRVPNAFSPNPNGPSSGSSGGAGDFNDVFLPVIQGLSPEPGSFHMLIYDRWGNLLFESWDENKGWDGYDENGKLLPLGVYVYKLDLKFIDGSSTIRIGDVTLIR